MQTCVNLLPTSASITQANHMTVGGTDGIDLADVTAYRLYGTDADLATVELRSSDDVGARPALRGAPATALDETGLTVLHTSQGHPQQGGVTIKHSTPSADVWGQVTGLVLTMQGGAHPRFPALGDTYSGVTVASVHGHLRVGIQVSFYMPTVDDTPAPYACVSGFATDGTGARDVFADVACAWDSDEGVVVCFVWDDSARIVHVFAAPPDGVQSHLASVAYVSLSPLLPGSQFGVWPQSSESGIVICFESMTAGDSILIRYIDVSSYGQCLFRAAQARAEGVTACADTTVCANEVRVAGVGGIESSADGTNVAAVREDHALALPAAPVGADGLARVYTDLPPEGLDQYLAVRLRIPQTLLHAGSFSTGIALCLCDGTTRYQATFLHNFLTRAIGLHDVGDPGIFGSHVYAEHDWSQTTLVEFYRIAERGIALRIDRGPTVLVVADPTGSPDDRVGAWVGQYQASIPSAPATILIDSFAHALYAWVHIPGNTREEWAPTEGTTYINGTDEVYDTLTDGVLVLHDITDDLLPACAGVSLQADIRIDTWYTADGYDAPRHAIGPLLWLQDLDGHGIALYAVKRADDTWAVYVHTSITEDLDDVLQRTTRGERISTDVPTLQTTPTMLRVTWDRLHGTQVWVGTDPVPRIQTTGWLPRPDSIPEGTRAAVGIGSIGTVTVGPTIYARARSVSIHAEVPEAVLTQEVAPEHTTLLLWGAS